MTASHLGSIGPKYTWRSAMSAPARLVPVIVNTPPPKTPASGGSSFAIVGAPPGPAPSGTQVVPSRCVPAPHVVSEPEPEPWPSQVLPTRVVPSPQLTSVAQPPAARPVIERRSQYFMARCVPQIRAT